jgi:uncharacterized protein DUF481
MIIRNTTVGRVLGLAVLILLWPALVLAAPKTDIVVIKNGDWITGEVKGVNRGKLDYSTDDAGRLAIEWIKVLRIRSPHYFEVEVTSGARYFGTLAMTRGDGILVVSGARTDTLEIPSVVQISPLDAGFFQRMRAYFDLGLSYAKANKATTLNTAGEAEYRGDKVGSKLSFSSYFQGQEHAPNTTRNSGVLQGTYFLPNRWSTLALLQAEQNDELDLELRLSGSALLGRVLVQSNSTAFGVAGGLAVTNERFSSTAADSGARAESNTGMEAVVTARWDAFRFDSPSLDFSSSLFLYPSLSNAGRLRGEFTTRLKYELFSDFDVGISLTDTFDSDPPDESATKNDFITSFTIGWSYRR